MKGTNKTAKMAVSAATASIVATAACGGNVTTAAFQNTFSVCADSERAVQRSLFVGFSNVLGPGTLWSVDDDVYHEEALLPEEIEDPKDRLITQGNALKCQGSFVLRRGASLDSVPIIRELLPAALRAGISAQDSIILNTGNWRWDALLGTEFETRVNRMSSGDAYVQGLNRHGLVVGRALWVDGFTMQIHSDREAVLRFDAVGIANISAERMSNRMVQITSSAGGYAVLQFRAWGNGTWAAVEGARSYVNVPLGAMHELRADRR